MEYGSSLISSIEKATGYKPTIGRKKALELLVDCKVDLQIQKLFRDSTKKENENQ